MPALGFSSSPSTTIGVSGHSFRTATKVPMPALSGSDRSRTTASKDELRNWFRPDVRSSESLQIEGSRVGQTAFDLSSNGLRIFNQQNPPRKIIHSNSIRTAVLVINIGGSWKVCKRGPKKHL